MLVKLIYRLFGLQSIYKKVISKYQVYLKRAVLSLRKLIMDTICNP